jgi:group I intron endonuclease
MIYLITNKVNGKRYIGKTTKALKQRWYKHIKDSLYGSNTFFHKAIQKYGPDNFTVEYLAEGNGVEEIAFIKKFQPEYNMTEGGTGGDTSSSPNYKTGMLRRNYKGANNPNYGKKGADSPNFGKKRSPEQINNIKNSEYLKNKRRQVKINGILYESVLAASRACNRSERWVRLHDELC